MTDKQIATKLVEVAAAMQREIDAAGMGDPVKRERDELRAEVERLQGEASRLAEALLREHVESERLQAVVETAAAMVRATDSDLADALLKSLAKPKEC